MSSLVGEHESEPIRGLPAVPPDGEEILWQGAPSSHGLARRAMHTRKITFYFALLVLWRVALSGAERQPPAEAATSVLLLVALGATAVGLLTGLAWLNGRATVYTITNRRIAIRFGVAVPIVVNIPFETIQAIDLKRFADGTGDIAIEATGTDRIGYLMMWPYVRAWHFGDRSQPTLRAVPDAQAVAEVLERAIAGQQVSNLLVSVDAVAAPAQLLEPRLSA